MPTCPQCAQLLPPEATRCPACGGDLHTRKLPPEPLDRDEVQDDDELLAAAIATGGAGKPPPWVPPLPDVEDDYAPRVAPPGGVGPRPEHSEEDVVPTPRKRRFWQRSG